MKALPTELAGPVLLQATAYGDERGFFLESYRRKVLAELGIRAEMVQDNHSRSRRGVLRGMHYQPGMGKLVRCVRGSILDVVVDIRVGSPQFGRWEAFELSDENHRQVYCPDGFGHGFCVLSELADVTYGCTAYWDPQTEGGFRFDDPEVGIEWPVGLELTPSAKDMAAPTLAELSPRLPFRYEPAGAFERNTPYAPTPDNRPAALEHSPLAFTRETTTQMSFGERAALEGVLGALAPRLAIEIGTAEGGTLARIARYAEEVHSIDISHAELRVDVGEGVHLHTAPSTEVLPTLLSALHGAGRDVDFALVDGDHSYDGVIADIRMLLDSPCTARCVILVHDSMNEEIRAGIEAAGIEEYPSVVYFEPDFVPGYVYRAGAARDMAWGGLALIICDRERSSGYAEAKRQWRYYEPFAAIQRMRSELRAGGDTA